jgi:hypothetical protein
MKTCSKCGEHKDLTDFNKDSKSKGGFRNHCKSCRKAYREENKDNIKKQQKDYQDANKDKIREYRERNKDAKRKYLKEYHVANKDRINERGRKWYRANKDKIGEYNRERRRLDPLYKVTLALRSRMYKAIKCVQGFNSGSTQELLGGDIETVKTHIEKQFTEGMSWDNYGYYGWHIDHIIPCASFDLTDPEQQKRCFHYTNLQPLWAEDNLRKNATISEEWNNLS